MELWIGAFNLGMMYGFLALGVFITSRILKFADITVDGTFTTGAAVGQYCWLAEFPHYWQFWQLLEPGCFAVQSQASFIHA